MKEIVERIAEKPKLLSALGVVLAVVLAFVAFWGFESVRAREAAKAQAKVEAQQSMEATQRAALQGYYRNRLKRLEKLQKKRAKYYGKPTNSQKKLSVAAIFVDKDGDGIPEVCIDHPALSYESKNGKYTSVSYDGMYMGNVSVALYTGSKVLTVPQKLRKKIRKKNYNIHPAVYISDDQTRISLVFQRDGAETLWDGYLYEVGEEGVRETAHAFDVRDNAPSERIGSMKITPEFRRFRKKFFLDDATLYKEMLSYDQEGNMKVYHSLAEFKEALNEHGILPGEKSSAR